MGSKRNVDMSSNTDKVKIIASTDGSESITSDAQPDVQAEMPVGEAAASEAVVKNAVKASRKRGKKYTTARSNVDKTKLYDPFAAIELLKRLSISKFDGTVTADLVVKEVGIQVDVTYPHLTGQTLKVAIATDELLEQIAAGTIDFDILLSEPNMVPKLAKYARVLGPRGLMPNPKNGTITPNPERRKTELEKGATTVKTERKQPVMHATIGKVSMETKDLVENLTALIEAVNTRLIKASITATMSPSVKVKIG